MNTKKLDRIIDRLNKTVIMAEESNMPQLKQRAENFIHIAHLVKNIKLTCTT